MSSKSPIQSLSIFSVKALTTTLIIAGVLLGYQEKIVGFCSVVVGFSLIAQTTQQSIRTNS